MRIALFVSLAAACGGSTRTLVQDVDGPTVTVTEEEVLVPFVLVAEPVGLDGRTAPAVDASWDLALSIANAGTEPVVVRTVLWSDDDYAVPTPWDWEVTENRLVRRLGPLLDCPRGGDCTTGWTLGLEVRGSGEAEVTLGGSAFFQATAKRLDKIDAAASALDLTFEVTP